MTQLLASKDPVLRAHAAQAQRGRPARRDRAAAELYPPETDVEVRRAAIGALAVRDMDASAPARKNVLAVASRLDPDGARFARARRAINGTTAPYSASPISEVVPAHARQRRTAGRGVRGLDRPLGRRRGADRLRRGRLRRRAGPPAG